MSDKIVNHFVLADGSTAKYDAGALLNLDDTVSLAGYAPDAKAVGDRLTDVENLAETLNEGGLELKDDVIATNVADWLDDHPEATTTVQDGAITEPKINSAFLPKIQNAYVTPEMFGAIGNGVADDTLAVQSAFDTGKTVFLKGVYGVTNTITINSSVFTATNSNIRALEQMTTIVDIAPTNQVKHLNVNLIVNAEAKAVTAIALGKPKQSNLNLYVLNCGTVGVDTGSSSGNNENVLNVGVMGSTTGISETGLKIGNSDLFFNSINVYNCRHGAEIYQYGTLMANNVHVWLSDTQMSNYYENSSAVFVNTSSDRTINIQWLYQDNIQSAILATTRMNAIIGTLGTNKSSIPNGSNYYNFRILETPTASHVYYTEFRGSDAFYPSFSNFSNACVYGSDTSMHNTLNLTLNANFSDANDAPPIGNWRIPWDTANIPFGTNSRMKSEVVGEFVVQTLYRGTSGIYYYKRQRQLGTDTWTDWLGVTFTTI